MKETVEQTCFKGLGLVVERTGWAQTLQRLQDQKEGGGEGKGGGVSLITVKSWSCGNHDCSITPNVMVRYCQRW